MFLSGTLLNALTVLVGTTVGLLLGARLPRRVQEILTDGIGLFTLAIGFALALQLLLDDSAPAGTDLAVLGALLVGAIALRALLGWLAEAAAAHAAAGVKHSLRTQVFAHIVKRGPIAVGGERTGELVANLTEGIEALDAYVARYLPQLALAALIPLTVAAAVFSRDPLSGAVLLVTAPLIPFFLYLIGRLADRRSRRKWQAMSRLSAFFLDSIQGLTTLKVLGRSRAQAEAIRRVSERFRASSMEVLRVALLSSLVLELLATLSVAVVAVEIGLRLLHGRIEFEQAFFILLLAPEFYLPLRALGAHFHAGLAGVEAADRLFRAFETPTVLRPADPAPMPRQPTVELDGVSYAYPGDDDAGWSPRPALHAVSLRIQADETLAIVGRSGAGKTTLARILLRFIEPDSGRLTADGVPATAIDPDEWRRRMAWVPQNPYLFADTVDANIRLSRQRASCEDISLAARRALADSFIADLPGGFDELVGEHGARLSGGQARRIALARALVGDPSMVVLDEPTADLDPRLQVKLDEVMQDFLADRTAVIIAHRIPTAINADRVVVLDRGRVIDEGAHVDLVKRCGLYRRLVASWGSGP